MSLLLKILGSSSKGNCGLLQCEGDSFLIDAGFSGKQIRTRLQAYGIDLSSLSGVFLTHEHQDHVSGLKSLCKVPSLRFYANFKTAQAIEHRYFQRKSTAEETNGEEKISTDTRESRETNLRDAVEQKGNQKSIKRKLSKPLQVPWTIFTTGKAFSIGSLSVQTFLLPHDAAEPVGYLFRSGNDSCAWATDIGHITASIAQELSQADTLVLEANHDETLLWKHPTRPTYLKERIAGPQGHLSNAETFSFLQQTTHSWKEVYLAHISAECNSLEILQKLFHPLAQEKGFILQMIDPLSS